MTGGEYGATDRRAYVSTDKSIPVVTEIVELILARVYPAGALSGAATAA
jgi:hypothetical protein